MALEQGLRRARAPRRAARRRTVRGAPQVVASPRLGRGCPSRAGRGRPAVGYLDMESGGRTVSGGRAMTGSDSWDAILERIEDGASLIGLDPDTLRILSLPERVLEVAVPIRRDNGKVEVFRG